MGALELELSTLLELAGFELEDWALELDDFGAGLELLEDSATLLDDDFISTLFEKKSVVFVGRENELDDCSLEEDLSVISMISIALDSLFSGAIEDSPLHAFATIPPNTAVAYIHILCIL